MLNIKNFLDFEKYFTFYKCTKLKIGKRKETIEKKKGKKGKSLGKNY
jgi:hypothetical protein